MPHILTEDDLGVFSRTWPPMNASDLAHTVSDSGFGQVHFNLASAGLNQLDAPGATAVRAAFDQAAVAITSMSATYNMIDPDPDRRHRSTAEAVALIHQAPSLGVRMISLCTGSRHPTDKWAWHPDNASPRAYSDLLATMRQLVPAAREAGVRLGVEPDPGNVIDSAGAARRLLRDVDGTVGVILDPGNLITPENAGHQADILDEAFDTLGHRIVSVHAKDSHPRHGLGSGLVDFGLFFRRWALLPEPVPVVIHDVAPSDLPQAREFVLSHRDPA
ncbi:sugar phosphate isomerase/epimerase family protein [Amycolatopsis sp. CA-230715]|uniref:sugar phosphate isomerase/epimerase family protein n=1 Tax=Amycolatopsis sp. CA-230715 TaxID=2745196 RepID=UPI001C01C860|nr:sugar phosphate isomerase/epimerase [Amycolatopsis sp. CA-230715]QWF83518.1 hypothetical protein HUW46_06959 [Amycolatopsis sp. CA-230715]